jgi:hypothetical protein
MEKFICKVVFGFFGMLAVYGLANRAITTHEAIKYNEQAVEYAKVCSDIIKNGGTNISGNLPSLVVVTSKAHSEVEGK